MVSSRDRFSSANQLPLTLNLQDWNERVLRIDLRRLTCHASTVANLDVQ
jgi:hypothetical protein